MSFHFGAAVWIDHHEARVYHVAEGAFDESTVKAPKHHLTNRHPKGPTAEHNHPDDLHHFFAEVARALEGAEKILVVGPSTAKLQFLKYAHKHAPAIEPHIVGIETVDHPTDAQLVAYIKHYFQIAEPRVH
ncbi:MAG: translational machinery protein [Polyangiaceae bacterium]|jgi:stalled ribosome rescue protein Dom34